MGSHLNSNRITAEYSGDLLTGLTHSSGQYLIFNYSGSVIQSVTDQTGEQSVLYSYLDDQLSGVTDVMGTVTEYSYLSSGSGFRALSGILRPDNTEQTFGYDDNGRLSTGALNGTTQFTLAYDIGTVMVTNSVDEATRSYFYDDDGNFVQYSDPLGRTASLYYNDEHALTGVVRPDGATSSFTYDSKGNLTEHIDPLEQVTQFAYGDNSRLTDMTDAEQHTTAYGYDETGNNTSRTSPDLTQQSYDYDQTGELLQKTNRRGTPTGITHDINGRITRIDYADNTFVAYTYNSVGNILSVEDVTGVTTLDYTANHQLERITYPGGRFLQYTYDGAGRRVSMLDHTGYRLDYAYNGEGLLESVTDDSGTTHAQYAYDAMGRLIQRTLGNGVYTTWQYNVTGTVAAVETFDTANSSVSFYYYEYDSNNRRTKMTSRDGIWDYTYDATGQLVHAVFTSSNADIASRDIEYVYDQVGNRVQEIANGVTTNYSVNSMNQYSQAGNVSYTYDQDGNLTGKTDGVDTWTYEYNANNRLVRSSGPEGTKEYVYNGLGQLATVIDNGVERHYIIDHFGLGNIVGEYDDAGSLVSRYIHGYGLVGKDDNYYTFDGNGNTSELTNAANEIVNFYVYEPFGKTLQAEETVDNDFQFVGQFGVREMGDDLIYMRNRFYAPSTGRFMAEDPIGLAGRDVSFYRYVLNDPVNWIDQDGLKVNQVCVNTYIVSGGAAGWAIGYYGGGVGGGAAGTVFASPGLGTTAGTLAGSELGGAAGTATGAFLGGLLGSAVCPEEDDYCEKEVAHCEEICRRAENDPDLRNVWGGSWSTCMNGCVTERCGGGTF